MLHKKLVEKIADFDYFLTPTELDALDLESNLIKKHQPFYNILLKDGKAFPYIKIDVKTDFPKVEVVRRIKSDGNKYFGPYITGISAYEIVDLINYVFPISYAHFIQSYHCQILMSSYHLPAHDIMLCN